MTRSRATWLAIAVAAALLVTLLSWCGVKDVVARNRVIRATAAPFLKCPVTQIDVGWSHEDDDNAPQWEVHGCANNGMVDCTDRSHLHGMWAEYVDSDYSCWFHLPLASGGYDPIGRKPDDVSDPLVNPGELDDRLKALTKRLDALEHEVTAPTR